MIIQVNVKPNSKEEYIEEMSDKEFLAHIKESAINGKANNALINLLAKKFKVSYKQIIIKNPRSRKKIIEIKE